MKDKKKTKSKSLLEKYNERETKGNVENTLIKGAVDAVASSVIGTGLGAIAGDKAPFAGLGLILAGHYFGDESGVLRITGASTLAFGIAKAKEYQNNPNLDTAQKRISEAKDDFLTAFHLKWKNEQKPTEQKVVVEEPVPVIKDPIQKKTENPINLSSDTSEVNGELDFEELTSFELKNEDLANAFNEENSNENQQEDISSEFDDTPDLSLI